MTRMGNFLGGLVGLWQRQYLFLLKTKKTTGVFLGSERGEEAADYQGYWNCPCGYLEFDVTAAENACKELKEETGVSLKENDLEFISYNDSPSENRQNVTFRFCAFIKDKKAEDFKFSHAGNEGKEVGLIKFIKVQDIKNYRWAFGHAKLIEEIFKENRPR